jgi:putative membrane protein
LLRFQSHLQETGMHTVVKALLGLAAASLLGTAQGQSTIGKSDQKIVIDIAQANMAEIEIGKLAQSKSRNDQVKTYAQQMIDDHTRAQGEVRQLASAKGVTLPGELDKKHKAMVDKLGAMPGDGFDKAYLAQGGVAEHRKMHGMLASAQKKARDPDVKALAAKMMPTIEQHLKAARQLSTKATARNAKVPAGTAAGK